MMKKIFLSFFAIALLLGANGYAKKKDNTENKTEEVAKKSKAQLKKEKREKLKQERAAKKAARKAKKEKSKDGKLTVISADKESYKEKDKSHKKEAKAAKKAKKEASKYLTMSEKEKAADQARSMRDAKLAAQKKADASNRITYMAQWDNFRKQEVDKEIKGGKYADLYKLPAWPFEMLYSQKDDLFRVDFDYQYATDSFDSKGSCGDITRMVFGEKSFTFQDTALALRLVSVEAVTNDGTDAFDQPTWIDGELAKANLLFNGEQDQVMASLNFSRYIKGKDLSVGVEVPVGYQAHRLKMDSDVDVSNGVYDIDNQTKLKSAQAMMLNVLLAPKGLSYLPKSSTTGIGDISTFINYHIPTKNLEKLLVGLNITWPSAKDASTSRVWATQLGSGFTKFNLYASMVFNRQTTWFNPHMFIKGTWSWEGHKKARVPQIIKHLKDATPTADVEVNTEFPNLAHSQRVKFIAGRTFTELDSQVAAFADHAVSVRMRPGPQVQFRLGNMFEKFIFRRAFLDLFYDFRAKWKDSVGGNLPRDTWAVDMLRVNTYQLEHKLGLDYSYMFDSQARFNAGCNWTFAGINVPQTFEGRLALGYEF